MEAFLESTLAVDATTITTTTTAMATTPTIFTIVTGAPCAWTASSPPHHSRAAELRSSGNGAGTHPALASHPGYHFGRRRTGEDWPRRRIAVTRGPFLVDLAPPFAPTTATAAAAARVVPADNATVCGVIWRRRPSRRAR